MATNRNKEDIQLRSAEVQEIIGHIPKGFMRYGIGLILGLLVALLVVCNFIPYSETKSIPMVVLPNVPTTNVQSPYDGTIVQCSVKDDSKVSTGDTLLSVQSGGQRRTLISPVNGKIRLCSFCVTNEPVGKGKLLLEIFNTHSQNAPLQAIADSLPQNVSLENIQTININLKGRMTTFKLLKIIEDQSTGKKQALFQSERNLTNFQRQKAEGRILINDGVLLDKLIKFKQ